MAAPAEILRMSSFCWTEICARWASNAVESSWSSPSTVSATRFRWSSTSRKNGAASSSMPGTAPVAKRRIGSRSGRTARLASAISRLRV